MFWGDNIVRVQHITNNCHHPFRSSTIWQMGPFINKTPSGCCSLSHLLGSILAGQAMYMPLDLILGPSWPRRSTMGMGRTRATPRECDVDNRLARDQRLQARLRKEGDEHVACLDKRRDIPHLVDNQETLPPPN
jgi:hypothetical protein